jgi:hypothetical protein
MYESQWRQSLSDQWLLMCPQVMGHAEEDDHMCSALVHMCGEVWFDLRSCRFLFTIMGIY